MAIIIKNNEMKLIALSTSQLEKLLYNPSDLLYDFEHYTLNDTEKKAIRMKLDKMEKLPISTHILYTFFLIVNTENQAMGMIGFKGMFEGVLEVGYGFSSYFRGHGHMKKALLSLCDWTFKNTLCYKITAHKVLIDNIASQKTLEHCGFELEEQTDQYKSYALKNPNHLFGIREDQNYITRNGAYVLFKNSDQKLGVVSVRDTHFLVGGGLEAGEDTVEALKREAIEEIGYSLKNIHYFTRFEEYHLTFTKNEYYHLICDVYVAVLDVNHGEPLEEDHVLTWINPSDIDQKLWLEYQKYALKLFVKGDKYGLHQ